jgi:DNA replication protein DnaC
LELIGNLPKPKEIDVIDCDCGEVVIIAETPVIGGPNKGKLIKIKQDCKCEDRQLAREAWEIHQRAKQDKVAEQFELFSLIPPKLKTATFDSYQAQNKGQEKAKERLEAYAANFSQEAGKNILLTGDYGTGKSHLTVATVKKIIENGKSGVFVDLPQLFSKIKATFKTGSEISEEQILNTLKTVDILVLDDLGAESMTDWRKETLLQLINARTGLCTLYTSNLGKKEMIEHLGERNFSKWADGTEIFKITGKDMRVER